MKYKAYPAGSLRFDLIESVLLLVFIAGGYVDGWAHNHIAGIESFFTPWHAVLYSGFALSALWVIIPAYRNLRAGRDFAHCLPEGYDITLLGIAIFAFAGFCDMIWHIVFGIEANTEVVMSPPHITLFIGTLLMTTGPIRSVVKRNDPDRTSWRINAPLVFALLCFALELFFVSMIWTLPANGDASVTHSNTGSIWSQRITDRESPSEQNADLGGLHAIQGPATTKKAQITKFTDLLERMGTATVIIFSALFAGVLLYIVKIGRVPLGTFTLISFVTTLGLSLMRELALPASFMVPQIISGLIAGIVIDALYFRLKPSFGEAAPLYSFAFAAPSSYVAVLFVTRALADGLWWSWPLIGGACVYAGAIGLLLAVLSRRSDFAAGM